MPAFMDFVVLCVYALGFTEEHKNILDWLWGWIMAARAKGLPFR